LAFLLSPVRGVLPYILGLRNGSETKRFMDTVFSKVGATGRRKRACLKMELLYLILLSEYIKDRRRN
jgi:hypothetical protein